MKKTNPKSAKALKTKMISKSDYKKEPWVKEMKRSLMALSSKSFDFLKGIPHEPK